jgi:hypothetical protein
MREVAMELYRQGVPAEDALPLMRKALLEKFPHIFVSPECLRELDAQILPFFSTKEKSK